MEDPATSKVCVACGADLATAGRMKDLHGRYLCLVCVEKLRQLKIRRRRAQLAARSPEQTAGMDSTLDHELLDDLLTIEESDRVFECPVCMSEMDADATVCGKCGFDVKERRVVRVGVVGALSEAGVAVPAFLERGRSRGVAAMGVVYILIFGVLPILDAVIMRNFFLIPMGVGMVLLASVAVLAYDLAERFMHQHSAGARARMIMFSVLLLPVAAVSAMIETRSRGRDGFMRTLAWANLSSLLLVIIAVSVDLYLYRKELGG